MINFSKYKVILWDFDGVVMDSMPVRDRGFEIVLASYPREQVEQLLRYHRDNGGMSRYVKFRYFFEKIRGEAITEQGVLELAAVFSEVMRKELVNESLLIAETVQFIRNVQTRFVMHVVSGSDQSELRYLCGALNIAGYFSSIHGSPTPKTKLVDEVMKEYHYSASDICFIGDSRNDWDAASAHQIDFYGYNNAALEKTGAGYIHSFHDVKY